MFQAQNYIKAKDSSEHLSAIVSSLRMQLDESNAEKRHLHYENKSLRARLDEIERGDKGKSLHRSSAQESTHGRLSGHGMDGTENPSQSQPYHTASLLRSESAQQRDHMIGSAGGDRSAGERNFVAAQVC